GSAGTCPPPPGSATPGLRCGTALTSSGACRTPRERPGSSRPSREPTPPRGQLVTSAVENRAQATEQKITAYAPNESSPWVRVGQSTGERSSASNDSHQCDGRYGCTAASCDTLSATSLATVITSTAAMAPIACSVSVEIATPIAPSAAIAAAMYPATNSSRSSPAASGIVVPDSSATGLSGNKIAPSITATAAASGRAHRQTPATAAILLPSTWVPPAGPAGGKRSAPRPASPAIESPATTATASGRTSVSSTTSARNARNTPLPVTWLRNAGPSP